MVQTSRKHKTYQTWVGKMYQKYIQMGEVLEFVQSHDS